VTPYPSFKRTFRLFTLRAYDLKPIVQIFCQPNIKWVRARFYTKRVRTLVGHAIRLYDDLERFAATNSPAAVGAGGDG